MNNQIKKLFMGKDSFSGGIISFTILAFIVLGCTCNKNFDLANIGKNTETGPTNQTDVNTTSTSPSPFATPKRTITKKADASKGEIPSEDELQEMVKDTLLIFNDAVLSGDFTDFHASVCKPWQRQRTPQAFKETFSEFVDKKIDIGKISSYDAEFTKEPEIGREVGYKTLMLEGKFPTSPTVTKFVLNYIPEGKEWKLSKIEVDNTSRY